MPAMRPCAMAMSHDSISPVKTLTMRPLRRSKSAGVSPRAAASRSDGLILPTSGMRLSQPLKWHGPLGSLRALVAPARAGDRGFGLDLRLALKRLHLSVNLRQRINV